MGSAARAVNGGFARNLGASARRQGAPEEGDDRRVEAGVERGAVEAGRAPADDRDEPGELLRAGGEEVEMVRTGDEIKWRGAMLFVSEALIGEAVGIREREDGHWLVRFADVPLLLIDRASGQAARFGPERPPRPKTTSAT